MIDYRYRSQCLGIDEDFTPIPFEETIISDDLIPESSTSNSYVALLACAIEVGRNVTEGNENDFGQIWETYEPVLQGHLENLANCADAQVCLEAVLRDGDRIYVEFKNVVRGVCAVE